MYKAVIFDMDGVIVDSEPLHRRAIRDTFAPHGVTVLDEDLREYVGTPTAIAIQDFAERNDLEVAVKSLREDHRNHLRRLYAEGIPISGALELLESVHASDLRLGLASSTDRDLIEVVLDRLALQGFFDAVVSAEEVNQPKPMPDIYLEAARRLDCEPKACTAIEDSQAGVLSAKGAGMRCIGFRSPHSLDQDIRRADAVVEDLWELDLDRLRGA